MYLSGKELASIKCLSDIWHVVNLAVTVFSRSGPERADT